MRNALSQRFDTGELELLHQPLCAYLGYAQMKDFVVSLYLYNAATHIRLALYPTSLFLSSQALIFLYLRVSHGSQPRDGGCMVLL